MKDSTQPVRTGLQTVGLVVGLVLFFIFLLLPTFSTFQATAAHLIGEQKTALDTAELAHAMQAVSALGIMMIVFWLTEALPLPVTGLLPLVTLPLLHISGIARATAFPFTLGNVAINYANPVIFLFMGGFLLAGGLQKWGIDRRLTLWLLTRGKVAAGAPGILLAVMGVTAFISMWVSNTATAAMMLPLGLGILATLGARPGRSKFGVALMIGIAWSASIGGIGTIIGTPPNGIALGVLNTAFGQDPTYHRITFVDWMSFGVPLVLLFIPVVWFLLLRMFPPDVKVTDEVRAALLREYQTLGRLNTAQRRSIGVFLLAAALWILLPFRGYFLPASIATALDWVDEYTVGILVGTLMFFLPAGQGTRGRLLTWEDSRYVEWGTLLLFGGGIALSDAMFRTGLANWISGFLVNMPGAGSTVVMLCGVLFLNTFLTEVVSNTAVTTMMAPVVIAVANASGANATTLAVGVAIAASQAFMLPVATPPNALVYGTGYMRIQDMAKAGFIMDLIGIPLGLFILVVIGSLLLGIFQI